MLAAVSLQIALTIAVDVEPPHPSTALHGRFPNSGMDSFALPRDVARESNIDREQARHLCLVADNGERRGRGVLPEIGGCVLRPILAIAMGATGLTQARRDPDLAHRFARGATLGPARSKEACGRAARSKRRKYIGPPPPAMTRNQFDRPKSASRIAR